MPRKPVVVVRYTPKGHRFYDPKMDPARRDFRQVLKMWRETNTVILEKAPEDDATRRALGLS